MKNVDCYRRSQAQGYQMLCCFIRRACTELCIWMSVFQLHKYKIVLLKKSLCAASCLVVCIFFSFKTLHLLCTSSKVCLWLHLRVHFTTRSDYVVWNVCRFLTGALQACIVFITLLMMRTCSRNLGFVSFLFVSLWIAVSLLGLY